ncbi:Putative F0F1-ATPase subunit [Candidatus Izimaplasma bacterium HR1]|jgi:F0F1-type ATP synthase assembly protein I|uniref:AtpZ/AtpI family protein n=1 Tax=Candidatus Izimoplasma sp. HR1 TaxID=1541959 RepID=UPI0004F70071|nr:Putative F0F1-ATPase subunit [Candidatus Izimaplasma bacterium HR1]
MKQKKAIEQLAVVSGFAFTMIVIIGVCVFLGIKLDDLASTSPLFTIIFSVFGIFAGIFNLIRSVSKMED